MSDDLTRLTEQERARLNDYDSWEHHLAIIESILAARTVALIDRAERAERERDEQRVRKDIARRAESEMESRLLALRTAVTGLADQWHDNALKWPYAVWADQNVEHANRLRALLTDEGDNQ